MQSQTSFALLTDNLKMDYEQCVTVKEVEGAENCAIGSTNMKSGSFTGSGCDFVHIPPYDKEILTKSTNSNNSNVSMPAPMEVSEQ
jgi:hypothetical protein